MLFRSRKSTSEIKQADSSGKARTIQVEVRKKRTFVKRDEAAPSVEDPATLVEDDAELKRREQEAEAQAELLRRQEDELAEGGIHKRDDLADLAVDELIEITQIDETQAKALIMKAREHWFTA